MRYYNRQKGFTLIELVVVITLIGILAAVGMPRFFDLSKYQASSLFDDTISALRYAQKRAVATQCQIRVNFATNASYAVNEQSDCNNLASAFSVNVMHPGTGDTSFANTDFASMGVPLSSTAANIIFSSTGTANTNATVTIGTKQITVVALTGLVCVKGVAGCP